MEIDTRDASSRKIAAWDASLRKDGQVTFRQDTGKLQGTVLLVFFAMVGGLLLSFTTSDLGDDAGPVLGWTALVLAAIFVPFAVLVLRYQNKTVVVQTEGIKVENGDVVPWTGLSQAEVQEVGHNRTVVLTLTPAYLAQHVRSKPWYSRLLIVRTAQMLGGASIVLSHAMQANHEDFVQWINACIANPPEPPVLQPIWYEKALRHRAASPTASAGQPARDVPQ